MTSVGTQLSDAVARRRARIARSPSRGRLRERQRRARDRLRLASSALLPATIADAARRSPATVLAAALGAGVLVGLSPTLRAVLLRHLGLGR